MAWTIEVWAPSGAYVVRAEPWNEYQGWLVTNWGWTLRVLQRLVLRNHTWTVRVRERQDDPFGEVQYSESVRRRREVPTVLRRVEDALHRGVQPQELARP